MKPAFERVEARTLLAIFTVTNTNGDASVGSLEYAITQSNETPGSNTIDFNIPGSGIQSIDYNLPLPAITVPVDINGTSQPGYGRTPLINVTEEGGSTTPNLDCLDISAGSTTVQGLSIGYFTGDGISLTDAGNDLIEDDLFEYNVNDGVLVQAGSNNNTITGNQFSDNFNDGIELNGTQGGGSNSETMGNLIAGNLIGTDATGTESFGNHNDGISIQNANLTTIGGTTPAARNVISGNGNDGMDLNDDSDDSVVEGNDIGTDITGSVAIPIDYNGSHIGIHLLGISNSTIGGTTAAARNVISGNDEGISSSGSNYGNSPANLAIQGNFIGTDATGTMAIPNGEYGVYISGPSDITIGGTAPGAGNVISSNGNDGIQTCISALGLLIQGNFIGTDITGTEPLGNGGAGIHAEIPGISIGGTTAGAGNIIDYNGTGNVSSKSGVDVGTSNTPILGNSIYDNASMGIDLNINPQLAAPVLSSAVTLASTSTIAGSLSGPAGTYTLQFFASVGEDSSGFAEGQTLLGTETLTATGSTTTFDETFPLAIAGGDYITATATSSAGETSEFSAGIVEASPPPTISASASSPSVIAGQQVTDTFTITNPTADGQADAGVGFSDAIPAGTTFVSGTTSTGVPVTLSGGVATAAIGGLAIGQSMTVSIVLLTSAAAEPSFTNTASVTATTPTVAAGADTASVTTTIAPPAPGKPTVSVLAATQSVLDGQDVYDTFTITNPGTGADAGLAFSDAIPAGTTFVSGTTSSAALVKLSGGAAVATIGALGAGQSVTVSIVLLTSAAAKPSFTNTLGVTATTPVVASGTDFASATTAVTPAADLGVSVTGPAPTTATGRLTLTATVTNHGPDPATGSTLTDTVILPTGATLASETASQGTVSVSGNIVTASFGSLANAATATLTLIVIAKGDAIFGQSAVVSGSSTDPNSANNSANVSVAVRGVVSISVIPSVAQSTPQKAVTLTAQVSVPPGFPAASKTITFYDATIPLGTVTLNAAGVATLPVTLIAVGTHDIAAVFSGDANYAAVVSSPTPVKIADPVYGDFDGDGKTDVAIYDQTSATFAVNNSGGGGRIALLGNPRDVNLPVYGDFDGDGKTDLAIYDQTTATFYVIDSTTGNQVSVALGNSLDKNVPVPGDFLGNGKTNYAIFDQTTATFYVLESGKVVTQQLGNPRDVNVPVAGDFDGDGKIDFAIFDQTQATFLILYSGGGSRVQQLGNSHDVNIPLAGDFDGDGRTDLAIYDQTQSTFLVLESGGGSIVQQFGIAGDVNVPVLGDFGGEGRADIAIFDTTIAEFLVLEWNGGTIFEKYGNPHDKSVPD